MSIRSHHRLWPGSLALIASIGVSLGTAGRLPGANGQARAASKGRPNIIVIQTDDQTYRELKPKVMPKTTRLLKRQGTTFTDYIVTTAQCCPSRASLITGQYPHNDGVFSNQDGYDALVNKQSVLPVWLHEAGYRTAHVGKFINGYSRHHHGSVAPGWDQWQTLFSGSTEAGGYYGYSLSSNGRRVRYGHRNRDYITRVLNRKAVRLVRRDVRRRNPFYLQLDQRAPHVANGNRPGSCARRYPEPDPRDTGLFRHEQLPKPP